MANGRLYFIDWLRVIAVLALFPFHAGRVFNAGQAFYVKGPQLATLLTDIFGFITIWHMTLLFALAGASTYLALGRRTQAQYATERVRRLLVPVVFGILVLIPPQTWYGARFNSGYEASYLHYLASGDFLEWKISNGGDYNGGFGFGHLWFILFLFIISITALPLWRGRHRASSRFVGLSRLLSSPAGWPIAGLAILIGEALPAPGGKNIFYYFVFFVLGYLAMCSDGFMEDARRYSWPALGLGMVASAWWTATTSWRDELPDPSVLLFLVVLVGTTAGWMVIVGLLGAGSLVLNRPSRALGYLGEASYPVYILHQTVIVVLAFYVIDLTLPWGALWVVLLVLSVVLTYLLYEGVRRVGWLRTLFGMRPRPQQRPAIPVSARSDPPHPAGDV